MKLKCQGAVAMIRGKRVAYVIIFLLFLKSFHGVHLLKNDPSLHIINHWYDKSKRKLSRSHQKHQEKD